MEEMIRSDRGRLLSDIAILFLTCRIAFTASATFYNVATWITLLLTASAVFFGVIILFCSVRWIYCIFQRLQSTQNTSTIHDEYRCIVLVLSYNLFFWGIIVVKTVTDSWRLGSSKEISLVVFSFLQILFTVVVTGNRISFLQITFTEN